VVFLETPAVTISRFRRKKNMMKIPRIFLLLFYDPHGSDSVGASFRIPSAREQPFSKRIGAQTLQCCRRCYWTEFSDGNDGR
jgi:hypothetical protein